jgi:LysR family glycine cleavage system transcriptional activator
LTAIRAFEAAARHGSISRAADELNVTPGAVSRHVRALEQHFGKPLFLRRATGIDLTSAGRTLSATFGEALDRIAEATSGVPLRRYRRLSIGVYGYFASRFLLPRLPALSIDHPTLEIDLHTSLNPLDLMPSRYDAVIAVSDGTPPRGMITHRLLPISTVPVCSPELLRKGKPDFATASLLHTRPRPDDWRRWLDFADLGSIPSQGGSSFESLGLSIEAAAAGLGYAIAIRSLIDQDLARKSIVLAHSKIRPTRRHFVLQYEARLVEEPSLMTFAQWLKSQIPADHEGSEGN